MKKGIFTAFLTIAFALSMPAFAAKEKEKKASKKEISCACDDQKDLDPMESEELRLNPGKYHNKTIKLQLEFKSVDKEDSDELGVHAVTIGKEKLHILVHVAKKEFGELFNGMQEGQKLTACGKFNSSTLSGYTGGELVVPPLKLE